MKKFVFTAFVCLVTMVLSHAQPKEDRAVLALCRQKFRWMIHDRVDSLAPILDDRLQFIHSTGWIQTRQEFLDDIKSDKLNYQKIEIDELQARMYGNTAVVTGKGTFSGTNTGEAFQVNLLFTEVYNRKGNTWQLITRHANKMP